MTIEIVIVGGGPAGVEAALAAKQNETNVTIISDGPIGGRAGWHSLLPSKVWLSAADEIASFREIHNGILPQFHPDLGRALGAIMVHQGVHAVQGRMVERLERDERVGLYRCSRGLELIYN